MFRYTHPEIEMNLVFNEYGLGDHIGQFPAVDYLIRANPHLTLNLWLPSRSKELAERCLFKTDRLKIWDINKDEQFYNEHIPTKAHSLESMKNFACHTTEHAFVNICGRQGYPAVYNYLKIDTNDIEIPNIGVTNYCVITVGYTSKTREMMPEVVNGIVDFVIDKGITPVFLGNTNISNKIDFSKGINLTNQTMLLQAVKIIEGAKFIVGLDNGLLHLAGTTEIPIIGGFTTVNPLHRMPYRHDKIGWNYYPVYLKYDELKCTFCQSNWCVEFNHDFRTCYYGDYQCVNKLTTDKYIENIKKVLI